MKRNVSRGEKSTRVTNRLEAKVEALGNVSLALDSGFILCLNIVLFMSSMRRNLISVSVLEIIHMDMCGLMISHHMSIFI